jgi:F0F1-type ATP synthase alpha subunit
METVKEQAKRIHAEFVEFQKTEEFKKLTAEIEEANRDRLEQLQDCRKYRPDIMNTVINI